MTKGKRQKKALIQPQYSQKEFVIAIVFSAVPLFFPLLMLLSLGRGHGSLGFKTISLDSIIFFAVILILQAGIIYRWIKIKGKKITGTELVFYWIGTLPIFLFFVSNLHDYLHYPHGSFRFIDMPWIYLFLPVFISGFWLRGWWLKNTGVEAVIMPFQKYFPAVFSYALIPVVILLEILFFVNSIWTYHVEWTVFLSLVCAFMILLVMIMGWHWRKGGLSHLEKAILFFSISMCTPLLFGYFLMVMSGKHWHGHTFENGVYLGGIFIFISLLSIAWMWMEQESMFE